VHFEEALLSEDVILIATERSQSFFCEIWCISVFGTLQMHADYAEFLSWGAHFSSEIKLQIKLDFLVPNTWFVFNQNRVVYSSDAAMPKA
jgi:hypothetical protein